MYSSVASAGPVHVVVCGSLLAIVDSFRLFIRGAESFEEETCDEFKFAPFGCFGKADVIVLLQEWMFLFAPLGYEKVGGVVPWLYICQGSCMWRP